MPLADPHPAPASLSIIIPMLNEAADIQATLTRLQLLRASGVELIVVDGGSTDASVALAAPLADTVLKSEPGRARQMNLGAQHARGLALLFLHADTRLPPDKEQRAVTNLQQALAQHAWGAVRYSARGQKPLAASGRELDEPTLATQWYRHR